MTTPPEESDIGLLVAVHYGGMNGLRGVRRALGSAAPINLLAELVRLRDEGLVRCDVQDAGDWRLTHAGWERVMVKP